jgi:hypothetical protein
MEVKKEPKIPMAATRQNLLLRSKMKTNQLNPVREVSILKASFKKRADKIRLDSDEIAPDAMAERRKFFFRKNWFFFDKKNLNS